MANVYFPVTQFDLTAEDFPRAFAALTGSAPEEYRGDTPWIELDDYIYHSTAVAGGHAIPLHQEVSGGRREDMPEYLRFSASRRQMQGRDNSNPSNQHILTAMCGQV